MLGLHSKFLGVGHPTPFFSTFRSLTKSISTGFFAITLNPITKDSKPVYCTEVNQKNIQLLKSLASASNSKPTILFRAIVIDAPKKTQNDHYGISVLEQIIDESRDADEAAKHVLLFDSSVPKGSFLPLIHMVLLLKKHPEGADKLLDALLKKELISCDECERGTPFHQVIGAKGDVKMKISMLRCLVENGYNIKACCERGLSVLEFVKHEKGVDQELLIEALKGLGAV